MSPPAVVADLDVSVRIGARTATALLRSRRGQPLQVTVDDAALLFAEAARAPMTELLRRVAAGTAVEVWRPDGTKLARRFRHNGRWRIEVTRHALAMIPRIAWIRTTVR